MRVDVDETRGDYGPIGIDGAAGRADLAANLGYVGAIDRQIGAQWLTATAVDDRSAANHHVMHGRRIAHARASTASTAFVRSLRSLTPFGTGTTM